MKCGKNLCPGGHHKFPSCVAQALYETIETPDWTDEHTGHTDYGFMALYLFPESGKVPGSEWSGGFDIVIPAGFYTLYEATSGAVSLGEYERAWQAREVFDTFAHDFAVWEEANEYAA